MAKKSDLEPGLAAFIDNREKLVALASSIVGNSAVAEELVQDSWLRWNSHDYAQDKARPIFMQIVANLSRDWLRRQKSERSYLQFLNLADDAAPDTERVVISRQDLALVVDALQELPERTVDAFYMNRIGSLTFKQISVRLDISTARAHQLVRNALVHLSLRLEI